MVSEARRRANDKYDRHNIKPFSMRFGPNDYDLLDWLNGQPNKSSYVKGLIRADMELHRQAGEGQAG